MSTLDPNVGLYGRQKGKRLGVFQKTLMEQKLPQLIYDVNTPADLKKVFGETCTEYFLEIGFGGGEHLAALAKANPRVGFIGCEPFENGVAKLVKAIEEFSLKNVRIYQGSATNVIAQLPDQALSRVYLLYPDPWPKRRHRKRRFVSDEKLTDLARVLKTEGELRFATDIDDYAGWTLARVARSTCFSWLPLNSSDWTVPWFDWTQTRYERKAISENRKPAYFKFIRI